MRALDRKNQSVEETSPSIEIAANYNRLLGSQADTHLVVASTDSVCQAYHPPESGRVGAKADALHITDHGMTPLKGSVEEANATHDVPFCGPEFAQEADCEAQVTSQGICSAKTINNEMLHATMQGAPAAGAASVDRSVEYNFHGHRPSKLTDEGFAEEAQRSLQDEESKPL